MCSKRIIFTLKFSVCFLSGFKSFYYLKQEKSSLLFWSGSKSDLIEKTIFSFIKFFKRICFHFCIFIQWSNAIFLVYYISFFLLIQKRCFAFFLLIIFIKKRFSWWNPYRSIHIFYFFDLFFKNSFIKSMNLILELIKKVMIISFPNFVHAIRDSYALIVKRG